MPKMPPVDSGPVLAWMLHPPELAALYDHWVKQDLGRAVPRWRPLDRETVAPWLGSLFIVRFPDPNSDEIQPGGIGKKILQRIGFDPTKIADEPPNSKRLFMEKSYLLARAERRPVYSENNFIRKEGTVPIPYTRLALPYANQEDLVDRLLCCIYFLAPGTRIENKTVTLDRNLPEIPAPRPEVAPPPSD